MSRDSWVIRPRGITKGNLITFRMKKNHTLVPMKVSIGTRIFTRYRVIAAPPAFAAIVVTPVNVP